MSDLAAGELVGLLTQAHDDVGEPAAIPVAPGAARCIIAGIWGGRFA